MYHIQKHLSYEKGLVTVKDLQVGKWYSELQGEGYSDRILIRKETDDSLIILHAWMWTNKEKDGYDLCFSEVEGKFKIYVIKLSPGLVEYHSDFSDCKWDNLSTTSVYNELYFDMYNQYMSETLPSEASGLIVQYSIEDEVFKKDYITPEILEELLKRY